jgi:Tfp pilus assembly protein PilO
MSIDGKTLQVAFKKYPVVFIVSTITVIVLLTMYLRSDLSDSLKVELEQKSAEANRYRTNVANSAQLDVQLKSLVEANRQVEARTLKQGELALNLQYFYRLEADAGIKYTELRPGAARPSKTRFVPINYSIGLEGTFEQVITFMRKLEQGPHFCRVNTFSALTTGENVRLNLNIDLLGLP